VWKPELTSGESEGKLRKGSAFRRNIFESSEYLILAEDRGKSEHKFALVSFSIPLLQGLYPKTILLFKQQLQNGYNKKINKTNVYAFMHDIILRLPMKTISIK